MKKGDKKLSILLVEDLKDLKELLESVINDLKVFNIQVAECLTDAEILLEENDPFSIVIIDLQLCGSIEDGIFLAEKVKEKNCTTIIVISTGYYDYLFDSRLINLPIDDFIRKPFDIEYFREKLLVWATLYKHRILTCEYLDMKMKKYEVCLDSLQVIENKLKVILDSRGFTNGGT